MSEKQTSDALFTLLEDSHLDIKSNLKKLEKFVKAVERRHLSSNERSELNHICLFFDMVARNHHADEEKIIIPKLLSSNDAEVATVASKLREEHDMLEKNWINIFPHLEALSDDSGCYDYALLSHGMHAFCKLYREHMLREESVADPRADK